MIRALLTLAILVAVMIGRAQAQADWRLTLDAGATSYSAAAHDTSADRLEIRPWRPTIFSLRVTRDVRKLGFGMTLGLAVGPLGLNIDDFVLLDGTDELLIELAPEIRYRLAVMPGGGSLHLSAGPVIDIWTPQDEETRTVLGGIGGVTLSLPLAGSWLVDVRGDLAITGSLLTEEDESAEIIRESTMRRGRIALGITRKL